MSAVTTQQQEALTDAQRRAVEHGPGALLVVAPPGAGKTRTLVARYAWLIARGVKVEEIMAITFTRKAAREMAHRISRETGTDTASAPIGTVHSIALSIMRAYPQAFGDLAERRVIGEGESERMVFDAAREHDCPVDELADDVSRWKEQLTAPKQALEEARRRTGAARYEAERRARAYAAYQRRLREEGALDFGDLVMALVHTMEQDPRLVATLRRRFRHVLVDEYQDINRGQERMIRLIAGPKANLWAVGDPDQAVYGFRGSDIRYILNFGRIYPQHTCVELDVNFRSTATIVEAANRFIANNRHRFGRVITSARASGTPLQFQGAEDPEAEANWVAGEIRKLIDAGTPAEEIAVLTRVAYHANWVEQALSARGVPFGLLGMSNFWGRPEVKQALGAISVLTRTSLVDGEPRLSRRLREAIGSVDPDDLVATAKVVCKTVARRPPKTISGQRREAWTSAMGLLSQEIERHKDPEALARKIRARSAIGEQSGKGVSVGTIHAAKGLEWAAVFLVACERDVLPHAKNPDLEEERRLAFVALTRARDQFVCSWSLTRSRKESAPSPFVAELKRAAQVSGA